MDILLTKRGITEVQVNMIPKTDLDEEIIAGGYNTTMLLYFKSITHTQLSDELIVLRSRDRGRGYTENDKIHYLFESRHILTRGTPGFYE